MYLFDYLEIYVLFEWSFKANIVRLSLLDIFIIHS